MIIIPEKTIKVKGTVKRKAHKRVIHFEGKVKDPVQFKFMSVTGINEMDQKISFTIHEFDKRVASGEGMMGAIRNMVNSKTKIDYISKGIDDPRIPIIMGTLNKIISDSNKGLIGKLIINISDNSRSNYDPSTNTINIAKNSFLTGNISHETGHSIEESKKSIHRACVKFLDRRTEGEDEEKLTDLFPGIGYRDDEMTKKDKFIIPGIGKIYPYQAYTEVLAVGLQKFSTPANMKELYDGDKEMFALCLAAISGRI